MTTATSSKSSGSNRTKQQQRSRQTSKARTRQSASSQGTSSQASGSSQGNASRSRGRQSQGTTVDLPFVTAEFHRPDFRLPTGDDIASAANTVRSQLPSREQALFYGALTLGTAFAMIEWPVALAIGVGTALAQHESRTSQGSSE